MGRHPEVTTDACAFLLPLRSRPSLRPNQSDACSARSTNSAPCPSAVAPPPRARCEYAHPSERRSSCTFCRHAPRGLFSRLSDRFRCSFHRRADLKRDMLAVHRACASPAGSQHLVAAVRSDRPLPFAVALQSEPTIMPTREHRVAARHIREKQDVLAAFTGSHIHCRRLRRRPARGDRPLGAWRHGRRFLQPGAGAVCICSTPPCWVSDMRTNL